MTTLDQRPGSPTSPDALTALAILEASGVDLEERLVETHALDQAATGLESVGSALWAAAATQIAELARDFLKVDVGQVLLRGWTTYQALVEAGDRTRGTTEVDAVDLAGHDLSLHRHPSVDVVYLDQTVARMRFDVGVDVHVEALTAVVRDGLLSGLGTGRCDVTATISVEGTELARAHRLIDPHLVVPLGDGIPLGHPPEQQPQRSVVR
ncbi:hypothetical protein [Nocardioides sp.]|uniref:hypothetical protein n=1 Tax=Nocardioides sp. TaxID=35761 RepID=UPI003566757B